MENNQLVALIKEKLKFYKISQVAPLVGLDYQALRGRLRGNRKWTKNDLKVMCEFLEINQNEKQI